MTSSSGGVWGARVSSMLTSVTNASPPFASRSRARISPARRAATRYVPAIAAADSGESATTPAIPATSTGRVSSGCRARKAATSPGAAGWPIAAATSRVKKSHEAT